MGIPSYLEDINELADELAANLTGEEVRFLLAKVGWQPAHTKVVHTKAKFRSPSDSVPTDARAAAELLKQFLMNVLAKLNSDRDRIKTLNVQVSALKFELQRLKASREKDAERYRNLQTKLKNLSSVRTHPRG